MSLCERGGCRPHENQSDETRHIPKHFEGEFFIKKRGWHDGTSENQRERVTGRDISRGECTAYQVSGVESDELTPRLLASGLSQVRNLGSSGRELKHLGKVARIVGAVVSPQDSTSRRCLFVSAWNQLL